MDLIKTCSLVCDLSKKTGSFIFNELGKIDSKDIETKGYNDFVTYVDKEAEKMIVSELASILPESGFLTEEKTISKKGERYNWIIDPLDGTTNFIHAIPIFSVSIALMDNDEIVLGVVYEINRDECFYSYKGGKAFLNDEIISVSQKPKLADSLLATGFPYSDYKHIDAYINLLSHFMKNCHGIRRLGSAAVDLAYVACGRFDGFYEYGLNPWDVAAGAFIVQQAGGKTADFRGGKNYIFGKEIISCNLNIYNEFLGDVKSFFEKQID